MLPCLDSTVFLGRTFSSRLSSISASFFEMIFEILSSSCLFSWTDTLLRDSTGEEPESVEPIWIWLACRCWGCSGVSMLDSVSDSML